MGDIKPVVAALFFDEIVIGHTSPRRSKINDFAVAVVDFERSDRIHCNGGDHGFNQFHHGTAVAVSLIEFKHGELRVVTAGHTLVTEVAVQLKDTFKTADKQTFEVKFRSNTHIHRGTQGFKESLEGICRSTSGKVLKHGGFNLHKAASFKELADFADDFAAEFESFHHFRIGDHIQITLTVTLFNVGQSVEFFGQRTQGFGKQRHTGNADGQFPHLGIEELSFDTDDITDIQFFEEGTRFFAQITLSGKELDSAGTVTDIGKDGFAHAAFGNETSGNIDFRTCCFRIIFTGFCKKFTDITDHLNIGISLSVRGDSCRFKFTDFRNTLIENITGIFHGGGIGIFCHF